MKQIWPNYSYSPATNVLTLTGLNIDRDQLLLVGAPERGRIMYNFADSAVTASAYTAGANTALTLVASTAGLTTTASLVIYYDDQLQSTAITISNFPATQPVSIASVTIGNTVTIAGTVTANVQDLTNCVEPFDEGTAPLVVAVHLKDPFGAVLGANGTPLPISGTVTIGSALPAGTNRIGVVTIGAGTVTIGAGTAEIGTVKPAKSQNGNAQFLSVDDGSGKLFTSTLLTAGTAQIGSVTASISGTVPVSISSVTVGNSVTIGSLPAISGTVTANAGSNFSDEIAEGILAFQDNEGGFNIVSLPAISGTVTANTFALQGTAVTTSNFTSTTASTVLANYNATREVLTIFNEGAGNLHICAGATCTTIAYQVRLSAGDYYEVPNHQTTITHSAVFATAGTARIVQIS